MSDVRIVVAGASGRMGRALVRVIAETKGCVLSGALEAKTHPDLGRDAGSLAGLKPLGVVLSGDASLLVGKADAIVDFTVPRVSMELAGLAAEAPAGTAWAGTAWAPCSGRSMATAANPVPVRDWARASTVSLEEVMPCW